MLRIQLTLTTRDAPKGVLVLHITIIQGPSTAVIVVLILLCLAAGAEGSPPTLLRCKSRACSVAPRSLLTILLSSLSSCYPRNP